MLKKSASGVLASLRSSTYRSVRLRLFARCGLAGRPFEHPSRCSPVALDVRAIEFLPCHNSFSQPARLPVDSNSRMSSSQRLTSSAPLRTIHPDSARRNPSEIPSRTRSVSAFLPGGASTGPRFSGNVSGLVSRPLGNCEAKHTEYSQPPNSFD